jgi:hypothetical protein
MDALFLKVPSLFVYKHIIGNDTLGPFDILRLERLYRAVDAAITISPISSTSFSMSLI